MPFEIRTDRRTGAGRVAVPAAVGVVLGVGVTLLLGAVADTSRLPASPTTPTESVTGHAQPTGRPTAEPAEPAGATATATSAPGAPAPAASGTTAPSAPSAPGW
ncbi:hypothetical protein [Corynebacterium bovis]|uniref:Uncharacterized protein n=1 Tax=Corynebacterium bovis DSM 20582 = CIP 54.80 TaxID=927655 RepID=A0A8H9YCM7_9CORY|nr:hypothetical protein [Corynebacterium bovis]MBB3116797.1 hypothetical protein [Corynebacterium bovis DSM 20582 = CIP 54.80]QQC46744.1 hypothetical protein I6I09_06325 [Corynebacterium bovis]WJY78407.1 hypothetical protein CBOVI_09605 [Corynebacterium bovis DSM 20582 = CIP 54.80]